MAEQEKQSPLEQETQSVTAWLTADLVEKLNRMVIKRSTAKRMVNRSDVIRDLIERAKE